MTSRSHPRPSLISNLLPIPAYSRWRLPAMFTHSPLVHPFTPRSIFCTWRQLPRPQGPPQRGRGIGREAGDSLRGGVAHAATKICRCHQPALVRGSYSAVPLHVLVLGSPGSLAAILPRFYVGPRGCKDSAMCLRPHRHLRRTPENVCFYASLYYCGASPPPTYAVVRWRLATTRPQA